MQISKSMMSQFPHMHVIYKFISWTDLNILPSYHIHITHLSAMGIEYHLKACLFVFQLIHYLF